jgi:predicted RNA-binding Zn-ribbon protein involved in translation (DUF1610 family)
MTQDEPRTTERSPIELEREKMLLLSQQLRSSRQLCPKCGQPTLERVHLPWYLKPLRLFRPLRAYSCIACGHMAILTGRPHGERKRHRKR